MEKSKVYFVKEISKESLVKIYNALGVKLKGNVGVKISTGEPGGHNFLNPKLHWNAIKNHGFSDIAPCDILDEAEEKSIKVTNGFHLTENIVGANIDKYDSLLILSHFKGHAMGGFGGALKNMSIGIASSNGKANIHTAGKTKKVSELWSNLPKQDDFLESMADACSSVMDYVGRENIVYINVANNLSVDCDCNSNPAEPKMKDIGIFASTDPVAVDQASVDSVFNSTDEGKADLIERINSRNGIHTIEASEKLNLGNREYEIIVLN